MLTTQKCAAMQMCSNDQGFSPNDSGCRCGHRQYIKVESGYDKCSDAGYEDIIDVHECGIAAASIYTPIGGPYAFSSKYRIYGCTQDNSGSSRSVVVNDIAHIYNKACGEQDKNCICRIPAPVCDASKPYCNAEIGECVTTPSCDHSYGQELNAEDCYCATDLCTLSTGRWCNKHAPNGNRCKSFDGTWDSSNNGYICQNTFGTASNRAACVCGTTQCTATSGLFCNGVISQCSADGTFTVGGQTQPVCQYNNGLRENSADCVCGSSLCTSENLFCDASQSQCNPSAYCSNDDGSEVNIRTCTCGIEQCSENRNVSSSAVYLSTCASLGLDNEPNCANAVTSLGYDVLNSQSGHISDYRPGCTFYKYNDREVQSIYNTNMNPWSIGWTQYEFGGYVCTDRREYRGLVCTSGVCSRPAACIHTDGLTPNEQPCACGLTDCSLNNGFICDLANNRCVLQNCSDIDGVQANARPCQCGNSECSEDTGLHCLQRESLCADRFAFDYFKVVMSGTCVTNGLSDVTRSTCSIPTVKLIGFPNLLYNTNFGAHGVQENAYCRYWWTCPHSHCFVSGLQYGGYLNWVADLEYHQDKIDCSETYPCICKGFAGPLCENTAGFQPNMYECICGDNVCQDGEYCADGKCNTNPLCTNTDGTIQNQSPCVCGTETCTTLYCNVNETSVCADLPRCGTNDGLLSNPTDCQCGSSPCTADSGRFCFDSICSEGPVCGSTRCGYGEICTANVCEPLTPCQNVSGLYSNTNQCMCGANACDAGDYCIAEKSQCTPSRPCLNVLGVQINDEACLCGTEQCQTSNYCTQTLNFCSAHSTCTDTSVEIVRNCISWRNTGACDPDGPREPEWDTLCNVTIAGSASGYCECESGRRLKYGCGHNPIRCDVECAKGSTQYQPMAQTCTCGTDICESGEYCRIEHNQCSKTPDTFLIAKSGTCASLSDFPITDESTCRRAWYELTGEYDMPSNVQCVHSNVCTEASPCICWTGTTEPYFATCPIGVTTGSCTCELDTYSCKRFEGSSYLESDFPLSSSPCTGDDECESVGSCTYSSRPCQSRSHASGSWSSWSGYHIDTNCAGLKKSFCSTSTDCSNERSYGSVTQYYDTRGQQRISGTCTTVQDTCHVYPDGEVCNPGQSCNENGYQCEDVVSTPCANSEGTILNEVATCKCGSTYCDITDGLYCIDLGDTAMCTWTPPCASRDGVIFNTGACTCGTNVCQNQYCVSEENLCTSTPTCAYQIGYFENTAQCRCGETTCTSQTGFYCVASENICVAAAICQYKDGSLRNGKDCGCGETTCDVDSGRFCIASVSMCSAFASCAHGGGDVINPSTCTCRRDICQDGEYCWEERDNCSPYPACANLNGSTPNDSNCTCGISDCTSGDYCWEDRNKCSPHPGCIDGSGANKSTTPCTCNLADCNSGDYCWEERNKCSPHPACSSFGNVLNIDACTCDIADCAPGKYCMNGTCQVFPECSVGLNSEKCMCQSMTCTNTTGMFCSNGACEPGPCVDNVGQNRNDAACYCDTSQTDVYCTPGQFCSSNICNDFTDCSHDFGLISNENTCMCNQQECIDHCSVALDQCPETNNFTKDHVQAPLCESTNKTCFCGVDANVCLATSPGLLCDHTSGICTRPNRCEHTEGLFENSEGCQCGSTDCFEDSGFFCRESLNTCSKDGLFDVDGIFYIGDGSCKTTAWLEEPVRPRTYRRIHEGKVCDTTQAPVSPDSGFDSNGMPVSGWDGHWPPLINGFVGFDPQEITDDVKDLLLELGYTGSVNNNDFQASYYAGAFLEEKMVEQCFDRCVAAFPGRFFFNVYRTEINDRIELRCRCVGQDDECTGVESYNVNSYAIDYEKFPPLLESTDPNYDENRVVECKNRCNSQSPDTTFWFVRFEDQRCACVSDTNDCSQGSELLLYSRYTSQSRLPACLHGDNDFTCFCGVENNVCQPSAPGLKCDLNTSTCSRPDNCTDTTADVENDKTCRCGTVDCTATSGLFCLGDSNRCLQTGPCAVINGTTDVSNVVECKCGQTFCNDPNALYCIEALSECSSTPTFAPVVSVVDVDFVPKIETEVATCSYVVQTAAECKAAAIELGADDPMSFFAWDKVLTSPLWVDRVERFFEIDDPNYPAGCFHETIKCEHGACGYLNDPLYQMNSNIRTLYFNHYGLNNNDNGEQCQYVEQGHKVNPYIPQGCKGVMDCDPIEPRFYQSNFVDYAPGQTWRRCICYDPTVYSACPRQVGYHPFTLNVDDCLCNENICTWDENKMSCNYGNCERPPGCTNVDGTIANDETNACSCASTHCMNKTVYGSNIPEPRAYHGAYCRDFLNRCDRFPVCNETYGAEPTTRDCMCHLEECSPGNYCALQQCRAYQDDYVNSAFTGPLCVHLDKPEQSCTCGPEYNVCKPKTRTHPLTTDFTATGTGLICQFNTSQCSRPAQCVQRTGATLNDAVTCACGTIDCWTDSGMFCYEEENMCSPFAACTEIDGVYMLTGTCMCQHDTCNAGQYCYDDNIPYVDFYSQLQENGVPACRDYPKCIYQNGVDMNVEACYCQYDQCDADHYCYEGKCTPYPLCDYTEGLFENTEICHCGDSVCDSNTGLFCYEEQNTCQPHPQCQHKDRRFATEASCMCDYDTSCEAGQFCDAGICYDVGHCEYFAAQVFTDRRCSCADRFGVFEDFCEVGEACLRDQRCGSIIDSNKCGCVDRTVSRCEKEQGQEPNNIGSFVLCTCGNAVCQFNEYCNADESICSTIPIVSCPAGNMQVVSPCQCDEQQCAIGEYCDRTVPRGRCMTESCTSFYGREPALCAFDGHSNGVHSGVYCQGECDFDRERERCCAPCPNDYNVFTSTCEIPCLPGLCQQGWLLPPLGANMTSVRSQYNPRYSGFGNTPDTCCVTNPTCQDQIVTEFSCTEEPAYTGQFFEKYCDTYTCTHQICCKQSICTCEDGTAAMGTQCAIHDTPHCVACSDTHYLQNKQCLAATVCGTDEYQLQDKTETTDRVCRTLTTCSQTQYETRQPSATNDRECTDTTVCSQYEYEIRAPNATFDRLCQHLTACEADEYEIQPPGIRQDRQCAPQTLPCNASEYEYIVGNATTKRVCKPLSECVQDQWAIPPTPTSDRECYNWTVCGPTQFELTSPSPTNDRQCQTWTECSSDEYQSLAPDGMRDRQCTPYTRCQIHEFVQQNGTTTTDVKCERLTVCNATEWEMVSSTYHSDRVCKQCDFDGCIGCMTTYDCAYDARAKIQNRSACSSIRCERILVSVTDDGYSFQARLHTGHAYRFEGDSMDDFVLDTSGLAQTRTDDYVYFSVPDGFKGDVKHEGAVLEMQRDCVYEATWESCGPTADQQGCQGTQQGRVDTITSQPVLGGDPCPNVGDVIMRTCEIQQCDIDCVVEWTEWSVCPASCGHTGLQRRTGAVIVQPAYKGTSCPPLEQTRSCVTMPKSHECACDQIFDGCRVCGGDNGTCADCTGKLYGRLLFDRCGICGGNGSSCGMLRETRSDWHETSESLRPWIPWITVLVLLIIIVPTVISCSHNKKQPPPTGEIKLRF